MIYLSMKGKSFHPFFTGSHSNFFNQRTFDFQWCISCIQYMPPEKWSIYVSIYMFAAVRHWTFLKLAMSMPTLNVLDNEHLGEHTYDWQVCWQARAHFNKNGFLFYYSDLLLFSLKFWSISFSIRDITSDILYLWYNI